LLILQSKDKFNFTNTRFFVTIPPDLITFPDEYYFR